MQDLDQKYTSIPVEFRLVSEEELIKALKGIFIALAQSSGVAQAVALVIIEAIFLIAVSILTPYMDKKTNAFNISICVINFISAVFLLVFSDVFNQPVCQLKSFNKDRTNKV